MVLVTTHSLIYVTTAFLPFLFRDPALPVPPLPGALEVRATGDVSLSPLSKAFA